jgi:hypothetical protein
MKASLGFILLNSIAANSSFSSLRYEELEDKSEFIGLNGESMGKTSDLRLPATKMRPITGPNQEFRPRQSVEAFYEAESEAGEVLSAQILFTAKKPTLNLDSYKDISSIECNKDLITVKFASESAKNQAMAIWSKEEEMALMVHSCKVVDLTSTLVIEKLISSDTVSIVIDTKEIPASELFDDLELTINQNPEHTENLNPGKIWSYGFDINYNPESKVVTKSEIDLFRRPYGKAVCKNCYSTGQVSASIKLFVRFLKVQGYEISLFGGVTANMDLDIRKDAQQETMAFKTLLFSKKFGAISVPGIFSLDPSVFLDAGVSFESKTDIFASYGYDLKFPFHYTVKSDSLNEKPVFQSIGRPLLNEHQLKVSKDLEIQTSAHLIPSIKFKLSVFNQNLVDANLELDNKLGVEVRTGGMKESTCPTKAYEIELNRQHVAHLDLNFTKNYSLDLYNSGELPIKCFFCGKCLKSDK